MSNRTARRWGSEHAVTGGMQVQSGREIPSQDSGQRPRAPGGGASSKNSLRKSLSTGFSSHSLGQGSTNSYKGPERNLLGLAGHRVCVTTSRLCDSARLVLTAEQPRNGVKHERTRLVQYIFICRNERGPDLFLSHRRPLPVMLQAAARAGSTIHRTPGR